MGIIKKNKMNQPPSPSGDGHSSELNASSLNTESAASSHSAVPSSETIPQVSVKPSPPPIPWTPDTIERGLVPDRRHHEEPVKNDRRRGYRRIEDRTLISSAHDEARAIKEKAYDDGYRDGMNAVQGDIEILRGIFEQLMLSRHHALESLVDDLAPISVEIAERIIKTEVSCDESLINTIVQDTLQKLDRKTRTVLIKVNPEDMDTVKAHVKENPPTHLDAEIVVIDDPIIDRGGCTVETNSGLIDASFSTRLEILKQLFGVYQVPEDDENDALLHAYHEAVESPSASDEPDVANGEASMEVDLDSEPRMESQAESQGEKMLEVHTIEEPDPPSNLELEPALESEYHGESDDMGLMPIYQEPLENDSLPGESSVEEHPMNNEEFGI